MMGIRGAAAANQTRLLGNIFNVIPVTNPARRWQRQHALINNSGPPLFFASIQRRCTRGRSVSRGIADPSALSVAKVARFARKP